MERLGTRDQRLLDAVLAVAADLSLPAVLRRMVESACELVGCRYGALGVIGADGRLTEFVHHGVDPKTVEAIGELPQGRGVLGALILDPRPLRLHEVREHPDFYGFPANHPEMHRFLGVPITVRGKVFGNLYLAEKEGGADFSEEDEALAVALAAAAGVAVENARLYEETRERERRLEALRRIGVAMLAGAGFAELLAMTARSARDLLGADLATIAVPAEGEGRLVLVTADGAHAAELAGTVFPSDGSVSGEVIATGRPAVLDDAATDERAHQPIVALGEIGPAVLVPLTVRERAFGTLAVANLRGGRAFTEHDLDLVQAFADQASVVVEYGRAQRELERLAVVEERERIARDLHDTVIQQLFATGMLLESVEGAVAPPHAASRIHEAVESLDKTIRDIRSAIFALQARGLSGRGLRSDVLALATEAAPALGFEPHVSFDGVVDSVVPDDVADDLLAVLREALTNVARHAGAGRVEVSILVDECLTAHVTDDGVGITAGISDEGGHGLRNMARRAEVHGGTMRVEPGPRGTELTWRVPLASSPSPGSSAATSARGSTRQASGNPDE